MKNEHDCCTVIIFGGIIIMYYLLNNRLNVYAAVIFETSSEKRWVASCSTYVRQLIS